MIEIWKDIKGYEGYYQVSNMGRVRSLDRIVGKKRRLYKGRVIMERTHDNGYKFVRLNKDNRFYQPLIHRLVAKAFIPNPENKPTVNHIDENKKNNCVDNLEWATYKENCIHGTRNERIQRGRDCRVIGEKIKQTRKKKGLCKKVRRINPKNNTVVEYDSIMDAVRDIGCPGNSGIYYACNNKLKTYKGYKWEYV